MTQWQEHYRELMFGEKHDYNTMTQAAKLKYDSMPDSLFKYREPSEAHFDALEKGVLYSATPANVNDCCREANIVFTDSVKKCINQQIYNDLRGRYGLPEAVVTCPEDFLGITNDHFKALSKGSAITQKDLKKTSFYDVFLQSMKDHQDKMLKEFRNSARSMYSMCCFSSVRDNYQMWGLYSKCHSGFCIEYGFKDLGSDSEDVACMFPVLYVDDSRIFVNSFDLDSDTSGSIGMLAVTLKTKNWEYEHEWRRLYPGNEGVKPRRMPQPKAIYMGVYASEETEQRLISFCRTNIIKLYKMQYDEHQDLLIPLPVR